MAPQPDNDNTPKAPDKNKGDKHGNTDTSKEKNKDFKTVNNLNDCELKDLLDEAITYKNPKDREGKSTLFKELLIQAEESERNARAASAGGSEQVRYCNTSAKRSKHRRKPNSISENVMHGGSLDNLAKEDLFEVVHHLSKPKRTVSARQREGGSLPSNVNAGSLSSYDPHFLEEARRKRTVRGGGPPEAMDVDMETASLLDHDSVAENYEKGTPTAAEGDSAPKFTTKATLQVNVDDALHFKDLDNVEKKPDIEQISAKVLQTKYSVFIQDYGPMTDSPFQKKVDENGNALHQNTATKAKKKKVQAEKNVMTSYSAEKLEGHRSDIIDDVDKLVKFIGEDGDKNKGGRQKQLHKNAADVGKGGKKQRGSAQTSKGNKEATRNELKKSNSLEEVSTTKLDGFKFDESNKDAKSRRAKEEGDNKATPKADAEENASPKARIEAENVNKTTPKARPETEAENKATPKTEAVMNRSTPKSKVEAETTPRTKSEAEQTGKLESKVTPRSKTDAVQGKPKQQTDVGTDKTSRSDSSCVDRSRERRTTDSAQSRTQEPAEASSTDFIHVVSKKKKTKKSSSTLVCARSGDQHLSGPSLSTAPAAGAVPRTADPAHHHHHASSYRRRTSSPPPRRKSVCSAPHSDKSNDSSDVDSVHSLPAESAAGGERRRKGAAAPASYAAAISRNAAPDRKRFADARVGRDSPGEGAGSPRTPTTSSWATQSDRTPWTGAPVATANAQTQTTPPKAPQQQPPPDVHNIKSFPAISKAATQKSPQQQQQARPVVQQQLPQQQRVPGTGEMGGARGVATYNTEQPQQHQQQQQRDLKTDLSIIQANEMETVQYNSQMMPNMEIPDVQTIEKLNYMNQPGAHMPPHLQHHVVPPQHLHMAMPATAQQRSPVVNQPPYHQMTFVKQPRPFTPPSSMPEIYQPQPVYSVAPAQTTVVAHHHHHHHHHPPHPMAFPPQAYEGVAVAYVDPTYLSTQAQQHSQQMQVMNHHHHHPQQQQQQPPQMQQVIIAQQQQDPPIRDKAGGKWAESDSRTRPKQQASPQSQQHQPPQRRFDRNHAHPDRRRDAPRTQQNHPTTPPYHLQHYHQQQQAPHQNQAVTLYRRDPVPRRGTRADIAPPPSRGEAPPPICDSASNEATNASDECEDARGAAPDLPPVVIMSGAPRDVPGIEFGFAVNPDLVDSGGDEEEDEDAEEEEDGEDRCEVAAGALGVCEMFEKYFRAPSQSGADVCNHDKVVHYLDSAWKDVFSSGKAQYYSPSKKDKVDSNQE